MSRLLRCRKCDAEIMSEVVDCPKCKTHLPFTCAVCGMELGDLQTIGSAYPFNKDGKALCPAHSFSLCDRCHEPFEKSALTLRVVRWERYSSGVEMPVNGGFCAACNAQHVDPPRAARRSGCLGGLLLASFLLLRGGR